MPKIEIRQIHLFILRYRKILVALGFSFIVWTISQNPPSGNLVLIATQFVPANSALSSEQFELATISDFDTKNYVSEFSAIELAFNSYDILPGSLLSKDSISNTAIQNNRVDIFVNLENQGAIEPGSRLHLWSQDDEFNRLVSSDGIVRKSDTDNYGTRLTISIPLADEYQVMQSNNIKVTIIN